MRILTDVISMAKVLWRRCVNAVRRSHLLLAIVEVSFAIIVSNCALAFAVFIYLVNTKNSSFSIDLARDVISASINSSEVIVYILAVLAPALWIMVANWRARKYTLLFSVLLMLQMAILICCFYIYGASKTGEIPNQDFVDRFARWCFPVATVVWLVTVYFQRAFLDRSPPLSSSGGSEESKQIVNGLEAP
ncbi:hypothetical protein D7Y33_14645 [Stenotrophomonas maltophilia]|uniref:DUF2569 domain-containing protein n=1 Tax=Stenotrophomonas maltophilia TaxID=40324 RepID=A0AAW3S7D5_STEMA|nr:hypothetical protein [Stenotrophomonas maltophilia]